jgi:Uma2 family endonuclease
MEITILSQLDPNANYTYADYLTWKFEEYVELIKGKVFPMAAPSRLHQGISSNLHHFLSNHLWRTKCKVYAAPFDVRLTRVSKVTNEEITTVVQPDLCVICDSSKLDDRGCNGAPDLMIEILSPGNTKKEMDKKFDVYEECGVKEYWLVDMTHQSITCYKLNDQNKYIGLKPYSIDQILTTALFEGLEIPLNDIFED